MNDLHGLPISEMKERWRRAQHQLYEKEYDAMLIPLGVNFRYFFAKPGFPTERLIAGIIPSEGDPFIIAPAFEHSNIQRSTGLEDIVIWEETESPYKILEKEFNDREIGNRIGVDPKLWAVEVERMQKSGTRKFKSVEDTINILRREKSEWEKQQLASAAKVSAEGILASIDRLKEGVTEKEMVPVLSEELGSRSGNPLSFAAVQFAENSAFPHGQPTDKKLKRDSVVLFDVGTSVNGYQGDITITTTFGKAPKKFYEVYDVVYEANRTAFEFGKVGTLPADEDTVARDHITSKGYGQYFTHRLGHGIGLEVHEHPYIVGTNQSPLVEGDTHSIEPGIYLPGEFGVRIEDDAIVAKDHTERLFDTPRHNFRS